jgi:hypothetical protein
MAQRTVVTILCDLNHEENGEQQEVEAGETIHLGWNGYEFEFDACAKHADEVRGSIEPIVEHARRMAASRASAPKSPARSRDRVQRDKTGDIRRWLKAQGHQVSDRGRIPERLVALYEAAH